MPFSTNPDAPRLVIFSTFVLSPLKPRMELFWSTFPTVTVQIARPRTRMRAYSHERRPVYVPSWLQEVAEAVFSGLILNDSGLGKRLMGSELH